MSSTESRSEHVGKIEESDGPRHVVGDSDNAAPLLITLGTVAVAALLAWATWQVYMGSPWTRDGTVRAYVVTMAPEVAGRIVKLPIADNQFVHKGDVLFEIEPADYRIALESAQAQAKRDTAALDYARANEGRQATLEGEGWVSKNIYQQVASTMHQLEAAVAVDRAAIAKAQLDLSRVVVRSPVNGYVTNLLAQLGDYANVGQRLISLVDADSFWIDVYFEETSLGRILEGDPATVKLMGYSQVVRGHVGGVARGINIPNAQPDQAGAGLGKSDLHLGPACAARTGAHPHRSGAGWRAPGGWHDGHRADRSSTQGVSPLVQGRGVGGIWLGRTAADLSRNL